HFPVSFFPVKFVRCNNTCGIDICNLDVEGVGYYSINTQHGPSILPFHRNNVGHTTNCTVIPEKVSIPVSLRSIENTTLGNASVSQNYTTFIRTGQVVRTEHHNSSHTSLWPANVEQIVFAVVFIHLRTFGMKHKVF